MKKYIKRKSCLFGEDLKGGLFDGKGDLFLQIVLIFIVNLCSNLIELIPLSMIFF